MKDPLLLFISHPVYGILSQQPEWAKTRTVLCWFCGRERTHLVRDSGNHSAFAADSKFSLDTDCHVSESVYSGDLHDLCLLLLPHGAEGVLDIARGIRLHLYAGVGGWLPDGEPV